MGSVLTAGARRWSWTVLDWANGLRADRAITEALERGEGAWDDGEQPPSSISRSYIQKILENASAFKSNEKLRAGTQIEIFFPAARSLEVLPEDRPLEFLYQDEHIAVVNKPAGLTMHPSETQHDGTLVNALLHHISDLSGIGGVLRPGIVHRLDKNTSGALVITKTDEAHQKLSQVFSEHSIERVYWALCYGSFAQELLRKSPSLRPPLKIESTIGRNPADRKKMAMNVEGGRKAITFVRKKAEFLIPDSHVRTQPFACWIEAQLETGRTHQVRVHLTSIGNALLGDPVYGTPSEKNQKWLAVPAKIKECVSALPGQALHARVLGFAHPITGERLRFEAEPPETFRRLKEALDEYTVIR